MRHRNDTRQHPGPKRQARLTAEALATHRLQERWQAAIETFVRRERNPVGLKRQFVPGTEFEGRGQVTAYFASLRRRNRRTEKRRRASRRRNRV